MLRNPARWRTPFGRFVDQQGVAHLAETIATQAKIPIRRTAIYNWVSGRTPPSPVFALCMVRISGGSLTLDEIYTHPERIQELQTRQRKP